jgi:hypothetical protein
MSDSANSRIQAGHEDDGRFHVPFSPIDAMLAAVAGVVGRRSQFAGCEPQCSGAGGAGALAGQAGVGPRRLVADPNPSGGGCGCGGPGADERVDDDVAVVAVQFDEARAARRGTALDARHVSRILPGCPRLTGCRGETGHR